MKRLFWGLALALLFITHTDAHAEGIGATVPALKTLFHDDFLMGTALNSTHFSEDEGLLKTSTDEREIVNKHFDSITPENSLKWGSVHPKPDTYVFDEADRYVNFGHKRGMFIIGHTLVWHSQAPAWIFQDQEGTLLTKDALLARMKDHIQTVVGRYRGKIHGWDVVNEALADDGSLRDSLWLKIIGEDYIVKAFEFAQEADPSAELYYNDYGLEEARKREGALKLLKKLQAVGVKITGVGMQGHYGIDYPKMSEIENTIRSFATLNLKVMITELDVNVLPTPGNGGADISINFKPDAQWNPYVKGLPMKEEERLAQRYAELFALFLQYRKDISRVTFWGVSDSGSWLNDFPVHGRTNYPLLFDRNCQAKPAFTAVAKLRQSVD
ncbi:endo-1,4-beta-xylanase [Prosthecobacter fusiformis]|uniref:Beta-xylanase n=1 Tax=Prosthecobacter fusiformis TaxID=48464 RepID=A0A4V3FES5_9BACT|nr:endo-1,4-beta-xylanase [Prosthecobacter fusiformis]TDU68103.1 endo-1,4-beta-xylanase [Prosthecobacter fusiformis]